MNRESKPNLDNQELGKKIIETSLLIDENMASLLKLETQKIRKLLKNSFSLEELEATNILLKNIIFVLMLTEEKIKYGIEICKISQKK